MRKSDRDREEAEGTASGDRAGQQELHPVAGIIIFILFYFRPFLVFSFHFILFHLFCFIFFSDSFSTATSTSEIAASSPLFERCQSI